VMVETRTMKMTVDLTEMGERLGLVVAKYPDGREGAQAAGDISSYTLDRYLAGKTKNVSLITIEKICSGQNISMLWLLYGDRFQKYLDQPVTPEANI